MKENLKIAVRALVEQVLRSGDLTLTFSGASRTVEAIAAHRKIQKSRPNGYEAEVPVSHRVETETFILEISGRIDGVFPPHNNHPAEGVTIDEIKTTTGDLDACRETDNPIHWGQAKAYAYLYALAHDLPAIQVQLTYHHLDSGERIEIRRPFDRETLADFFRELVDRYLAWISALAEWHARRDSGLDSLSFPFSDFRPGQREMAVLVYKTIQHGRQLLVQAPTGIGKTMAAVFPALKAMGKGFSSKIFYLTARTTARTVAEKAVGVLAEQRLRLKTLTLTAKDKICFFPESACNGEECPHAKGYYDRINGAMSDLFSSSRDIITREAVEEYARKHEVCPFEFSLDMALWADLIICDYNYAFDPRVHLRRFFSEEGGDYAFLIDEAHNLVDRAREMFSAEIRKQPFLKLRGALKETLPGLYKTLGRLNTQLVKLRRACMEAGGESAQPVLPPEIPPLLTAFHHQAERWLSRNKPADFREDLLERYFEVGAFLNILEGYDENYVTLIQEIERDIRLKLFCLNPRDLMRAALGRCRSAVFFSATLTPAAYFKHLFGCGEAASHIALPSPFPEENFRLLLANGISTRYRDREESLNLLTRFLFQLISATPGNLLVFFPSYEYMKVAHAALCALCPQSEVIIQVPGMSESEREAFLDRFTDGNRRLVGFAVMGGIFGEGIDLEGDRLSAAAIVGVGLPGICIENELIRQYFDRVDSTGFEYAYQYPGLNRVLQAAGRVIRSETDRGAVLLIDDRYAGHRYQNLLPDHWHPVQVRDEAAIEKALSEFWKPSPA